MGWFCLSEQPGDVFNAPSLPSPSWFSSTEALHQNDSAHTSIWKKKKKRNLIKKMQIIFCLSDKFNQLSEDCKKSSIGSAGEGCEQMRGQKQRERKEKQLCPFWGQQVCWAVEHKEKSPEFCVQLLPWTNTAVGSSDQQFTNTREQIRVLIGFFSFFFFHGSCSFSNFRVKWEQCFHLS